MTKTQLISQSRQSKQPSREILVDRWTLDCSHCSLFQRMPHFCMSWRHTYCIWHPLSLNPCIKEIYNLPGEKQTNDQKSGEKTNNFKGLGNGGQSPRGVIPDSSLTPRAVITESWWCHPLSIYIDWAHVSPAATLVFWARKYPVVLWLPSCPLYAAAKVNI